MAWFWRMALLWLVLVVASKPVLVSAGATVNRHRVEYESQQLLEKLGWETERSEVRGREVFEEWMAFSMENGVPGPVALLNVALCLAKMELSREGPSEYYLKAAEGLFPRVFPGRRAGEAWDVVIAAVEAVDRESPLAFHLKTKRARHVLEGGRLSAQEEAAVRLEVGEAALAEAKAALSGDKKEGFRAMPYYALAYEVVSEETKALEELLGKLGGQAAESTGTIEFLLKAGAAGVCFDPAALYEALSEFVDGNQVSSQLVLRVRCEQGRYLLRADAAQSERAFELMLPFCEEFLSGNASCLDPKALLGEAGSCALRLGRWEKAEALLEGAEGAWVGISRGSPPAWEISLKLAIARARQGDEEGRIDSLKAASKAPDAGEGERHNVLRRLGSVYERLGDEGEFVSTLGEADLLGSKWSLEEGGFGRFWGSVAPMPGTESGARRNASPLLVSAQYLTVKQWSPALVEPGATVVEGRARRGLDLTVKYVGNEAREESP